MIEGNTPPPGINKVLENPGRSRRLDIYSSHPLLTQQKEDLAQTEGSNNKIFGDEIVKPRNQRLNRRTLLKKAANKTMDASISTLALGTLTMTAAGATAEAELIAKLNDRSFQKVTGEITHSVIDAFDPRTKEIEPYLGPSLFIDHKMQEIMKELHIRPKSFLHETGQLPTRYKAHNEPTLLPSFHPAIYKPDMKQMMYNLADDHEVGVNQIALLMTIQTLDGTISGNPDEYGPFALKSRQFPRTAPQDRYDDPQINTQAAIMEYKTKLAEAIDMNSESSTPTNNPPIDPNNVLRAILAFKYGHSNPNIISSDYKYDHMTPDEQQTYREVGALLHIMEMNSLKRASLIGKTKPNSDFKYSQQEIDSATVDASESSDIDNRAGALDESETFYRGSEDQVREFISRDIVPEGRSRAEREMVAIYRKGKNPYTKKLNPALRSMNVDGIQGKYADYTSTDFTNIDTSRPGSITE